MKIKQKNKFTLLKKIFLAVFVVVALATVSLVGMYYYKIGPFSQSDTNTTQTETNNNDAETPSPPKTSKTPVSNQATKSTTSTNNLSASISYVQQTNTDLKIGTLIEGVTSYGNCKLTLTKNDKKVTDSAGIQALASSSTCKGFDVPIVSLSKGVWDIMLDIKSGSKEAHLKDSVTID